MRIHPSIDWPRKTPPSRDCLFYPAHFPGIDKGVIKPTYGLSCPVTSAWQSFLSFPRTPRGNALLGALRHGRLTSSSATALDTAGYLTFGSAGPRGPTHGGRVRRTKAMLNLARRA